MLLEAHIRRPPLDKNVLLHVHQVLVVCIVRTLLAYSLDVHGSGRIVPPVAAGTKHAVPALFTGDLLARFLDHIVRQVVLVEQSGVGHVFQWAGGLLSDGRVVVLVVRCLEGGDELILEHVLHLVRLLRFGSL